MPPDDKTVDRLFSETEHFESQLPLRPFERRIVTQPVVKQPASVCRCSGVNSFHNASERTLFISNLPSPTHNIYIFMLTVFQTSRAKLSYRRIDTLFVFSRLKGRFAPI